MQLNKDKNISMHKSSKLLVFRKQIAKNYRIPMEVFVINSYKSITKHSQV